MSRKKNKRQATSSEIYALCITAGFVVGLGLSPLLGGSTLALAALGALAGAVLAYVVARKSAPQRSKRHH